MSIRAKEIITQSILPQHTNRYDIGSTTLRWNDIFTQNIYASNCIGIGVTSTNYKLYVNGNAYFAGAISGNLSGNATSASYVKDRTNNTATYLNYGATALSSTTHFACWNSYELREISPENARISMSAAKLKAPNDFVHSDNEVTMVPSGYNNVLWLNYRTTGGTNGNISTYNMGNGSGGHADIRVKQITANSSPQAWIWGQKSPTAALNVTDSTNTGSYWPWIRQKLNSGYMVSMGTINSSLFIVGSASSRTENGYDHSVEFDVNTGSFKLDRTGLEVWNNIVKINNYGVRTEIGALNGGWCHIYNYPEKPFIFNNDVFAIGAFAIYECNSRGCGTSFPGNPSSGQIFFKFT